MLHDEIPTNRSGDLILMVVFLLSKGCQAP